MAYRYQLEEHYTSGGGYAGGSKIPCWLGNGTPFSVVALHDTEGAPGRAGALGTISFFIATAAQRNASYHELWAWDAATRVFTVLRIVRPQYAAGSIAPQPIGTNGLPLYAPDTWARRVLGVNADDPNQGAYAVSIAGTVAQVNAWALDPDFVHACDRRLDELHQELGVVNRAEHFRFNPRTRTDWGKVLSTKLHGGLTWQPFLTAVGYHAGVGPGVVTMFAIPGGTLVPSRSWRTTWARASGADVLRGAAGFWRIAGGGYAGRYLIAGRSGPFTISRVERDPGGRLVYTRIAPTGR